MAVRTVDGKIRGLAPQDGHELWTQEQQVPRLSLRGTSQPVIVGDLTLCGFDNGKVIAVNMNDGTLQWEIDHRSPRTVVPSSSVSSTSTPWSGLPARMYLPLASRAVLPCSLSRPGRSGGRTMPPVNRGIGLDDQALYVATADGDVVALRRRTGAEVWRQKALAHRGLSAIVTTDNAVVVADYQGNVHWLDKATG